MCAFRAFFARDFLHYRGNVQDPAIGGLHAAGNNGAPRLFLALVSRAGLVAERGDSPPAGRSNLREMHEMTLSGCRGF
jgi:hypothetical protein